MLPPVGEAMNQEQELLCQRALAGVMPEGYDTKRNKAEQKTFHFVTVYYLLSGVACLTNSIVLCHVTLGQQGLVVRGKPGI